MTGAAALWAVLMAYAWAMVRAAARPAPKITPPTAQLPQAQQFRVVPSRPFDHDKDFT